MQFLQVHLKAWIFFIIVWFTIQQLTDFVIFKENWGPSFLGNQSFKVNYQATFKMSPWQHFFKILMNYLQVQYFIYKVETNKSCWWYVSIFSYVLYRVYWKTGISGSLLALSCNFTTNWQEFYSRCKNNHSYVIL